MAAGWALAQPTGLPAFVGGVLNPRESGCCLGRRGTPALMVLTNEKRVEMKVVTLDTCETCMPLAQFKRRY